MCIKSREIYENNSNIYLAKSPTVNKVNEGNQTDSTKM